MDMLLPPLYQRIVFDRETGDYAMFLDGDFKGYAATYHAADIALTLIRLEAAQYRNCTALLWTLYRISSDAFYRALSALDAAQLAQQADLMASYRESIDIGTGDGAAILTVWTTRLVERARAAADVQPEGAAHDHAA